MTASQDTSFARLVSLAAHDLRTPLATVHGFAQTIQRTQQLEDPLSRYIEMMGAAAEQMTELLELLGIAARIEGGRYDPVRQEADTLELARTAAERAGAQAEGEGAPLETDVEAVEAALAAFASCAQRHGGVPDVTLTVAGADITVGPVGAAGPVVTGEELKDLGSAVGTRVVRALGGEVALDGDLLRVKLT